MPKRAQKEQATPKSINLSLPCRHFGSSGTSSISSNRSPRPPTPRWVTAWDIPPLWGMPGMLLALDQGGRWGYRFLGGSSNQSSNVTKEVDWGSNPPCRPRRPNINAHHKVFQAKFSVVNSIRAVSGASFAAWRVHGFDSPHLAIS